MVLFFVRWVDWTRLMQGYGLSSVLLILLGSVPMKDAALMINVEYKRASQHMRCLHHVYIILGKISHVDRPTASVPLQVGLEDGRQYLLRVISSLTI